MRQTVLTLLTMSMLLVVSQAMAFEQPTINSPREGATLGPNYDVIGTMPYQAFLVVMTDVVNCDTNETIASIPGIRRWTNANGSFHFRVASPRVSFGEKETNLSYRVRVFEADPNDMGEGEAALVSTECVRPSMTEAMSIVPVSSQQDGEIMITSPGEGDALGPNYDIEGRTEQRALIVVLTDVMRADTNEVIRTVPGIRHWTNMDGSFHVRVASPRVSIGEKDAGVSYRVRIFEASRDEMGPETIINASMAQ